MDAFLPPGSRGVTINVNRVLAFPTEFSATASYCPLSAGKASKRSNVNTSPSCIARKRLSLRLTGSSSYKDGQKDKF